MNKKVFIILLLIVAVSGIIFLIFIRNNKRFDGNKAFDLVKQQVNFGPRTPGSDAHSQTIGFIRTTLQENDWDVEMHNDMHGDYLIQNIIGKREYNDGPVTIIAAHYDTRFYSDQDPDPEMRLLPVPGANDGASGVGILLELSRVLPKNLNKNIWFVFFDAEDQGNIENWDWILGSRSFVSSLNKKPENVVIIDMVGDSDLNIYYEHNSDPKLNEEIWNVARTQGFENYFLPQYKYRIHDDHVPFIEAGIQAIDIIDFDYPYWHTQEDTVDKISENSLYVVGQTLYEWLLIP